ncbi:hypothetical protein [Paludisphaera sp.]|uniref:hypothetical protein n=1 Tax=Paludisphaera sp. TaxID=2017432 RepID=UPI00301BED7A
MLIVSLALSSLLLFVSVRAARRPETAAGKVVLWTIGLLFLSTAYAPVGLLPAVLLQALLMLATAVAWSLAGGGPSALVKAACAATLAAYVPACWLARSDHGEYARLRGLYPYESMESRVREPRRAVGDAPPGPDALARLARLEGNLQDGMGGYRAAQLRRLHEDAVWLFINSPGFGVARMGFPTEWTLKRGGLMPAPRQLSPRATFDGSPGGFAAIDATEEDPLGRLLDESILGYANARGFGYIKDRRHIAGFQGHGFSEIPAADGSRWRARSLELVGLLDDEPVVYVSDELPGMGRPRGGTRPLDRFEGPALEMLRRGEDLCVVRDGEVVRMLGAVRSGRRCVECHGGDRGDLLGAFSYVLGPEGVPSD